MKLEFQLMRWRNQQASKFYRFACVCICVCVCAKGTPIHTMWIKPFFSISRAVSLYRLFEFIYYFYFALSMSLYCLLWYADNLWFTVWYSLARRLIARLLVRNAMSERVCVCAWQSNGWYFGATATVMCFEFNIQNGPRSSAPAWERSTDQKWRESERKKSRIK